MTICTFHLLCRYEAVRPQTRVTKRARENEGRMLLCHAHKHSFAHTNTVWHFVFIESVQGIFPETNRRGKTQQLEQLTHFPAEKTFQGESHFSLITGLMKARSFSKCSKLEGGSFEWSYRQLCSQWFLEDYS